MPVMCQLERENMIERVDFFARQVKRRVWDSFDDFGEQVQDHGEDIYRELGANLSNEYFDLAHIADIAYDESIKFSELLFDLRRDMTLASVAALYHQWEKDLKRFLARELRYYAEHPDVVWTAKPNDILEWLEKQGWPYRSYTWFPVLDACRLIVNAYKHGKGRSLDELKNKYPQYLGSFENDQSGNGEPDLTYLDHEDLLLTDEQFDKFVEAVKQFWNSFPNEIHLKRP